MLALVIIDDALPPARMVISSRPTWPTCRFKLLLYTLFLFRDRLEKEHQARLTTILIPILLSQYLP